MCGASMDFVKNLLTIIAVLVVVQIPCVAQMPTEGYEFSRLYDCSRKSHEANPAYNADYDLEFLDTDLFYILDRHTPELYLFTPHFAGKVDLPHYMKIAIKAQLDAHKISSSPFPFTPCCQGGLSYHFRIPYFSDDPLKPKGYFYMTINDPTPLIYDEAYFGDDHKMHVKRHDVPIIKVVSFNASVENIPRFLPGVPQSMPDFTDYKPKQVDNFWTSTDWQKDKGVEYDPLDVEGKLWDKNAQHNFLPEAKRLLLADVALRIRTMPPELKEGDRSSCWGHLGCNYTISKEMAADSHKKRSDALDSCKAAADEFHLDIFP
jgi:hypothetical protein